MPFENFFQQTDKRDLRFGMIFLAVGISMYLAVWSYNYLTDAANEAYKPPPENLSEPQRFLKAAALCDDLPKPERFERVNTQPPIFTASSAVVYHGYSSERDFDETLPTFLVWFAANGWKRTAEYDFKPPVETLQPTRQLIFGKGNSTITVIYYYPNPNGHTPTANYEFKCRYEDISFGIYD